MAIEIVSFPIKKMVDLSIAMLVHQRVWYEASPFMQFIDFSKIPDGKEL